MSPKKREKGITLARHQTSIPVTRKILNFTQPRPNVVMTSIAVRVPILKNKNKFYDF